MRPKHRRDKNHGKNGWVGGNPRWGKHHGNWRGQRCRLPSLELEEQPMSSNYPPGVTGNEPQIAGEPEPDDRLIRALRHIAAHRSRPSVRLLDVLYGPQAKTLRTGVAAILLDRKVTGSDKEAQYGNLRKRLIALVVTSGGAGSCTAEEDAFFEAKAEAMLVAQTETGGT